MIIADWNAVVGEVCGNRVIGKYELGDRNKRGDRLVRVYKENNMVVGNALLDNHKRKIYI